MRSFNFILAATTAFIISGCATTYDPAEVCTADWIKPRAERAVTNIESETRSAFNTLRKNGKSFADGKSPGPFQILAMTNAVSKLTNELKDGRGMKDLHILRNTCNEPEIVSDALSDLMRDQGLPEGMINFIEGLDVYQDVIEQGMSGAS